MTNTNIVRGDLGVGTGFIPTIFAQTALNYLANNIVAQKMTTSYKGYSSEYGRIGETMIIPKYGNLAVNDKAENQNYTLQEVANASSISLTLNKHKEVSFAVERRAMSEVNQDVLEGYAKQAAIKLAEQIDIDIMTAMYTGATGATIGTSSAITEANVQAAKLALTVNKAGEGMKRFAIVSPQQTINLLGISNFVLWTALGQPLNLANGSIGSGNGSADYTSRVGRIYQFDVRESQLVPIVGSSPAVSKNLFFAEDAVLFASRKMYPVPAGQGVQTVSVSDDASGVTLNLTYWYNALAGAYQMTLETLYGVVLQRPEHVCLLNGNG